VLREIKLLNQPEEILKFQNVSLKYGQSPEILKDLNFSIERGSFHYLTGVSGAGKSSLLRMIYLDQKPTQGRIILFGEDIKHIKKYSLPSIRRKIGVVFQDFRLINNLTVLDNVALPMRIVGAREQDVKKYVIDLLNWVGLGHHIYDKPEVLSGGQQQRVAIARALIGRPDILLADEPTGNVDDDIAMRLMYFFSQLHKLGTTVLVATHNESLIARVPHPQWRLENGNLVKE
jgi:cell division transport system ATP-binding protein